MANAIFSVASLDPAAHKENFINWLQSQSQFSGYNFQGANFNVILDVLARNTMLEAFYLNMVFNEMFLDSAQNRDSVVSRAKEQNYCPTSMSSSMTNIDISITTTGANSFSIPFGTRFSGMNSNGSFIFTTNKNYFETSILGKYTFSNVSIFEGNYINEVYSLNNTNQNQKFIISNPSVDTSSLKILVFEDGGVSTRQYQIATDLYNLNGNSNVFFLQAGRDSTYEIYFGDGVIGHQPPNGSVVQIYYRACAGTDADNISNFSILDNLQSINGCVINSIDINTKQVTSEGAPAESIESIRFNAPRNIQTQERAATAFDYETLIKKKFPQVADVSAYKGGITTNGVEYGSVLISCVTTTGNPITQIVKDEIINYCSNLDLIHSSTKMIDATTLYVDVASNVHVDFSVTNNSISFYKENVTNTINTFSKNNLQKFKKVLRYSKLADSIDEVDTNGIVSNELSLSLKRFIPVTINTNTNINISFNNPIESIKSDHFIYSGLSTYITDRYNNSSNGMLFSVFLDSNNNTVNYKSVGTVNYKTGDVNISNLNINQYMSNNSLFYINAVPTNKDIYAANNDIIKIDSNEINVNIIDVNMV